MLLIDDIDATFQNTLEEKLELSTLFSACRSMISKVEGLAIRVTIRADVWPLVRKYDESLDKVEQYIKDISWREEDFRKIIVRRISNSLALSDGRDDLEIMSLVFVESVVWNDREQPLYRALYTLSYKRPRWGIQLAKLGKDNAIRAGKDKLDLESIELSMLSYGTKRIYDLVVEHRHQCSSINEILSSFRKAPKRMSKNELIDWINRHVTNHINVIIDQVPSREPLKIAGFLYRIGFIVARNQESPFSYRHITYEEAPDFFSSQVDDGSSDVSWEIHPCYRQVLETRRINDQ